MLLGSPEKTVQGQDGQHASEKPSEANKQRHLLDGPVV